MSINLSLYDFQQEIGTTTAAEGVSNAMALIKCFKLFQHCSRWPHRQATATTLNDSRLKIAYIQATVGPGKTLSQGPPGEKIFQFLFLKYCMLVYFTFLSDGGALQTLQGPR